MGQITGIIDIHAHILPGVDDGSRTMDESCQLLRMAVSQGISSVIATPHYSRRHDMPGLEELADRTRQEFSREFPDFGLYLGQETYYHEELPQRLKSGKARTMAGSSYVLVEFDPNVRYEKLFRGIRGLLTSGYIPILAHMERYGCLKREGDLAELADSGCIFQMNYESLAGNWLQPHVRWCRRQVSLGRIHLLGTDMHRIDYRYPDITGTLKWLESHVDEGLLEDMVRGNALRVIRDQRIGRSR